MTRTLVDELIWNESHNEVVFVKYLDQITNHQSIFRFHPDFFDPRGEAFDYILD
jgi:hypothetical protein